VAILEQIIPYLRVKKVVAELILNFSRSFVSGKPTKGVGAHEQTRREEFYLRAKKLNARGARASTERREAERLCDSQYLRETVRGEAEEPFPPDLILKRLH
jgi:hypothetical protein